MNNQITTQKTMFLHVAGDGRRALLTADMTEYDMYGVCVGEVECSITYTDIDADPRAVLISALEQKITDVRTESQVRINVLTDRVNQLKCLEYKAAES